MNWTYEHDVMLCREILVIEPPNFKYGSRERGQAWEKIAQNLNQRSAPKFNVDQRAVRDHFLKLERMFKRKVAEEERASGISTESTELDMAMEEIVEKSREAKEDQNRKNEKKEKMLMQGKAESVWKRSMERLSEISTRKNLARAKKRQKMNENSEAVEYLREKSAKEGELKEKEPELKEKKLLRPISTSFGFRMRTHSSHFASECSQMVSERSHLTLMHSDGLFVIRNRLANLKFPDSNSQSKCCTSK